MSQPSLTRQQWLERCAAAYDAGDITDESLKVLERWADAMMRLQGGQFSLFFTNVQAEFERTQHFNRTLGNDRDGYAGIQFLARLRHHCEVCATDPTSWITRACPHPNGHNLPEPTEFEVAIAEAQDALGAIRFHSYPAMLSAKVAAIDRLKDALQRVLELLGERGKR